MCVCVRLWAIYIDLCESIYFVYIYTYTHTHTLIYIFLFIYFYMLYICPGFIHVMYINRFIHSCTYLHTNTQKHLPTFIRSDSATTTIHFWPISNHHHPHPHLRHHNFPIYSKGSVASFISSFIVNECLYYLYIYEIIIIIRRLVLCVLFYISPTTLNWKEKRSAVYHHSSFTRIFFSHIHSFICSLSHFLFLSWMS